MTDFKYESKDLEVMSFAENYHIWILNNFKKYLGKSVAEVGAGSGSFSSLLLNTPIEKLVVVEPDKNMCRLLQQNISNDKRVTIENSFFGDVSSKYTNCFDAMIYVNVFEHIEDERNELSHIQESLQKDGVVCIFVPALSWLYSAHDKSIGHYRRYHKKQLKSLLENSGFEIVSIKYFDFFGILPWFIMFKLLKRKPNSGNVGLYDKYIVPIAQILESAIPMPIGKNLIVVGRKISNS